MCIDVHDIEKTINSCSKSYLTVSFQFHHTQMDGVRNARFFDLLQREINAIH